MPDNQIAFVALEEQVSELLVLLQDRQPGMTAAYPIMREHVGEIGRLAGFLLHQEPLRSPPPETKRRFPTWIAFACGIVWGLAGGIGSMLLW